MYHFVHHDYLCMCSDQWTIVLMLMMILIAKTRYFFKHIWTVTSVQCKHNIMFRTRIACDVLSCAHWHLSGALSGALWHTIKNI
jgi:hypothetical protein